MSKAKEQNLSIDELATFCKRKGFVFKSSEIYGGFSGFWDYGPLGAELFKNLKSDFWKFFVHQKENMVGIEAVISVNLFYFILDKIKRLTLITALLVVGYCLTAPLIYRLLFPAYQDAVFYSQIYMLGVIAIPGISLFGTYFQVRKDTKTLYKLSVISNLSTIVLTFVLISRFGLLGAVIENGISWFLILAIYIYYFHKDKPTNLGVGSPS